MTAPQSRSANSSSAANRAAAAQAAGASQNARDALRRTSQAIDAVRAMQSAARTTAAMQAANHLGLNPHTGLQLPEVPNGLGPGGLEIISVRSGALDPVETAAGSSTLVTVKQTAQQALLHWKTLNVGRDTTLHFDQSAGGSDSAKWVAYNKVFDPSGLPSQIIGAIKAEGQVYVLNPNGIIFGPNSQVNARGLTASSLPLNDNLRQAGLLNNRDAQFLLSGLSVPGGSDGTAPFDPFDPANSDEVPLPTTADGRFGDVVVQPGAKLTSPMSAEGNGGRIMLAAPNVRNEGTISTSNGQTVIAAGLQVGVQSHDLADPSLRGLDVWVGNVGNYGGTVEHAGLIESPTGSVTLAGSEVRQMGVIESSTSVALNGRIDISASYGAVGNPGYDNAGGDAPPVPFLLQETGVVTFGPGSVTRILPDYASGETVPGTALPEVSRINVEGLAIHLGAGAMLLAPNGDVALRAGRWPYQDLDGNRTTLDAAGVLEPNLNVLHQGGLLFDRGQVDFEPGSLLNVAGSTDVYVPLAHSILTLKLTGPELADSPLQRTEEIRGVDIAVDIRKSGAYDGRYWVGTPLGDVTGFVGLIERNAAQLTTAGGNVTVQAGNSVVLQAGSAINVSGGYSNHEGGVVQTTRLRAGDRVIDIAGATPDRLYDGIFDGTDTAVSARWGISQSFSLPLAPLGTGAEPGYVAGGEGGSLQIIAPSVALDGELTGLTVTGPRQRTAPPESSSLRLSFTGRELYQDPFSGRPEFIPSSPTPPSVVFQAGPSSPVPAEPFLLVGGIPAPLRADRLAEVFLPAGLLQERGFGNLAVDNPDGDIVVPAGVSLDAPLFGSIDLTGANLRIGGSVSAPGGALTFQAQNFSPNALAKLPPSSLAAAPAPNAHRGWFTLAPGTIISAAGPLIDERFPVDDPFNQLLAVAGGRVTIDAFGAELGAGSAVDVSGGVTLDVDGGIHYGSAGSIAIRTGKDPNLGTVRGGTLTLGGALRGYSGGKGGSLTLQATAIQAGGASANPDVLLLQPSFFQQGGFTDYRLIGIGAPSAVPAAPGDPDSYLPAVAIAPGTVIEPRAEQLRAALVPDGPGQPLLQRILAPLSLRSPANLHFEALGADDPFTAEVLEVRGDIVMGTGSRIATDPGATVSLDGETVTVLGSILAPGGTIAISGDGAFPLAPSVADAAGNAKPTVHLGRDARFSTAGTTVFSPDPYGHRIGRVYPGGTISITGNLVAEAGARLDVAGTSAVLDHSPMALGIAVSTGVLPNSGLTAPPGALQTLPVQVDSAGGLIRLTGSEMLYSDATLAGQAGGPTAAGGRLSVFSGRFYPEAASQTGADINLIVTQSGRSLAAANLAPGIGRTVLDASGFPLPGAGAFVAERFLEGGFDSLDLGSAYLSSASPVPFGGNLRFQGPVDISARGVLQLAGGGVIEADAPVRLSASLLQVGQPFRPPLHPDDQVPFFQRWPVIATSEHRFAPTSGPGSLTLEANLIDVGTLSLQNIGTASMNAGSGDIRGNGTLNLAGALFLQAGQVYPTTLSAFNIFAYDAGAVPGSVTITGSGSSDAPLAGGGSLNLFASRIHQAGVLRAPLGSIALGWDGTGTAPLDRIAGGTIAVPVAGEVNLGAGSLTSVSGLDSSGAARIIPFGLSPDGLSWVDPAGVNVTISGLPEKRIALSGDLVTAEAGAVMDLRGGGDLYAYRWVRGTGGSMDLLGSAPAAWSAGTEYEAGDLVSYQGHSWSARVGHSGQAPAVSAYWSRVAESFAVLPDDRAAVAPVSSFNTGANASLLAGNPGYVDGELAVGDRIYLEASTGLAAGYYTLLPRGYARLPGAFLVTPLENVMAAGVTLLPDGASHVSGYRFNQFSQGAVAPVLRSRFEVAPGAVVRSRAEYEDHLANSFMQEAAGRLVLSRIQLLPEDAAALFIHGNAGLEMQGSLLTGRTQGARGSKVDLSSFAAIHLIDGSGMAPAGATAVLRTDLLSGWGAESLLVGGLRRETSGNPSLEVRTARITLDNPGASLSSPEIILASRDDIAVTAGSSISSAGPLTEAPRTAAVEGDGTLVRVSGNSDQSFTRTGVTRSMAPLLTVAAGAALRGASVLLDSTSGTSLDPAIVIDTAALALGSGQISVLFQDPGGPLAGAEVDPHLVLSGDLLAEVQRVQSLTLQSYRSIDFYGTGSFGSSALQNLELLAGGLRGFNQGAGMVSVSAGNVWFSNPAGVAALPPAPVLQGVLAVAVDTVQFGANAIALSGYQEVNLTARSGVTAQGAGAFSTAGNLELAAPVITGARGATREVTSAGALVLSAGPGVAGLVPGLGASYVFTGSSVSADTAILAPSGRLALRATSGDVSVAGQLDVGGSFQAFYDVVHHAGAGEIRLESASGNVVLQAGSLLSVAAHPGGGDGGVLAVSAPGGVFSSGGTLLGTGGSSGKSGSFSLDAGGLPSYASIRDDLLAGGFSESQSFRLRAGGMILDGITRAADFSFFADQGSITVSGTIDASGITGGSIALAARDHVMVQSGAVLTAAGQVFDNAGKGGSIRLEAGSQSHGVVNTAARLTLQSGSEIDLSVAGFVPGDYTAVGSSACSGKFQGQLHLRAPRVGGEVGIDSLAGSIRGASSVLVEGYRLYDRTSADGVMNLALRNEVDSDAAAWMAAGETGMRSRLLAGNPDPAAFGDVLVLAPGVEIINRTGDLTLGLANNSPSGSTNTEALSGADWDLSTFRYGSQQAPGVLTLRAQGDLVFNNALSDGFTPVTATSARGHSRLWLASPQTVNANLPVNAQSWSYRLTAGADLGAANHRDLLSLATLDVVQPGKGSVLVGEFYPAVPNSSTTGGAIAVGPSGLTANTIRISTTTADRGTRYEVIRTGTGSIDVSAGRDVQLRNQFATIYTAGVAVPTPTAVADAGDFVVPVIPTSTTRHPGNGDLGAGQQLAQPRWTLAGGDVRIEAGGNAGRYTLSNGVLTADSSRQLPNNWLYRRGYVDPATGKFASNAGVDGLTGASTITDSAASTAWWVDFTNFFQGIGALGGGNVSLETGGDLVNLDAVIPTNARMPGRDPGTGQNLAPDASRLLEWGGGDLSVRANRDISGGIYYVERGSGQLAAVGEIATNSSRSPSLGILGSTSLSLDLVQSQTPAIYDARTWMPTTLFAGRSAFEVSARGDVLLGPVANTFLLPQGLNNQFWYKTYFHTFSGDAGADVTSIGGNVTHRWEVTLPGSSAPRPVLETWLSTQNLYAGVASGNNASHYQPWLRLAELDVATFDTMFALSAPSLRSTAFAGDVTLTGSQTFFPSPTGTLELLASGNIHGLAPSGRSSVQGRNATVWAAATVNLSDADPGFVPGVGAPLAYQSLAGRDRFIARGSGIDVLATASALFTETGSYTGAAGSIETQRALHASPILHVHDTAPVRVFAAGGDVSGLTLFSPKHAQVLAERDITDVAFYLQNTDVQNVSIVAAGRDIVPYNENAALRTLATDPAQGNLAGNSPRTTVTGTSTTAMAGDVQISGPGLLEVLAGRNLDLGTGANFSDGTGVGITSISNSRNPFLPFGGADLIAMAGVPGAGGTGAAQGLSGSSLDFASFIPQYAGEGAVAGSAYLRKLGIAGPFAALAPEQQAVVALEVFYRELREAGQDAAAGAGYDAGFEAIETLFGSDSRNGEIFTRARDIRTVSGGSISLAAPAGGSTMASDIFGNPLAPPGIVTEYGGEISLFTHGSVGIGQARIFTLRGGDLLIWSSRGDIAAGSAPRTVVTAPPTRVVIDANSASVQTDLGGLATGGGIGVLASVQGVEPGSVDLIAPFGVVDAGDAGIRATGDITIAAVQVLNASNIAAGGASAGVPSAPAVAAPNLGAVSAAASASAAASSASQEAASQSQQTSAAAAPQEALPSLISVEVIGYGGGDREEEREPQPGGRKLEEEGEEEKEKEEESGGEKVAALPVHQQPRLPSVP